MNYVRFLTIGKINVDYLGDDIDSYSIDQTTANPVLKQFTDGGSLRQIVFDFTVVAPFSKLENLANSRFCEEFTKWVEEQNRKKNLPWILGIQSIECTAPGRILQRTETLAIYVIQMQVAYYQKA